MRVRNLNRLPLHQALRLVEPHQVEKRIVQRPKIGVDLLRKVARQKAEAFARFNRRTREHDSLHRAALEGVDRGRYGEIGLARACRPDAEADVVLKNRPQVRALIGRAAAQIAPARLKDGLSRPHFARLHLLGAVDVVAPDKVPLHVVDGELLASAVDAVKEHLERPKRALCGMRLARYAKLCAATGNRDVENRLHLAEIFIERTAKVRERRSIVGGNEGKVLHLCGRLIHCLLFSILGHDSSLEMRLRRVRRRAYAERLP